MAGALRPRGHGRSARRSPGERGLLPRRPFSAEPYLYVGPHDAGSLADPFWNAPFGAYVTYQELRSEPDPAAAADAFINRGLAVAADPGSG